MAEKSESGFGETIKTVVIALLLAGLIRTLFFQPFWIPSSSMKPTLLIGDFLFVNKMAYGYSKHSCPMSMCSFINGRWMASEPERGDIIVFKKPGDNVDFIKRLVGLPGDKVQMKGGQLYLNGALLPQQENGLFEEIMEEQGPLRGIPACSNRPVARGAICEKEQSLETMPEGKTYNVLNVQDDKFSDDTLVYTVPPKHYFFVGDNRDNSSDSRSPTLGFVHEENLMGRADRVIFSSAGRRVLFFWTWRSDRFFKSLN